MDARRDLKRRERLDRIEREEREKPRGALAAQKGGLSSELDRKKWKDAFTELCEMLRPGQSGVHGSAL